MNDHLRSTAPNGPRHGPEAQLVPLFLLSSAMLVLADGLLSGSTAMTIAACKLYSIALALSCSAALLWRKIKSVELTVIIVTAYMALVLWVRHDWILVPLIVATVAFLASPDLPSVARIFLGPTLWLNAGLAAALILSVT